MKQKSTIYSFGFMTHNWKLLYNFTNQDLARSQMLSFYFIYPRAVELCTKLPAAWEV